MVYMKIIVFIIFFLLLGGFLIISNENLKLDSSKNINKFFYEYGSWLGSQVNNSINTVGYVIHNNPISKNQT